MAKLHLLVSACCLLPLAAAFRPERIFSDMNGNQVRDAVFGIAGLCATAGECFEERLKSVNEGAQARYKEFEESNPWQYVYGNGTDGNGTDFYREYDRKFLEFEVENMGPALDDMCSALAKAHDECAPKCEVDKGSVYGTLSQPLQDFVCKERIDEVKSAITCIRRLTTPLAGDVDLYGECPPPRRMAQQWLEGLEKAARGGEQLNALADKVLGANGLAAKLCKENACYTEHFQALIEEQCGGEKTTVIKDFQAMVTPHLMQIIDGMHIGCLVPDGCKETLPFAAVLALIADMS